jgi:hypothetical protein
MKSIYIRDGLYNSFYFWLMPSGWRISIMLKVMGLQLAIHLHNVIKHAQFIQDFLKSHPTTNDTVQLFYWISRSCGRRIWLVRCPAS